MLSEYMNDKTTLLGALEKVSARLGERSAAYAVLETDDPATPFEIRWVNRQNEQSDAARIVNERLFDRGFLDFGFKEIRGEDNLEGVVYGSIEELFADSNRIGVAPLSFFDDEAASVRMARGADENESEDAAVDLMRFPSFLSLVKGRVVEGEPGGVLTAEEVPQVCGLLFRYSVDESVAGDCIVAFQRTQRMWIQQKSSYLLFDGAQATPEAFSSRSIRVGTSFDFCLYGDNLYFRSLKALEILFKFNKLASQHAKDYADTLDPILADFEKLDERIDASRGVANKLLKMQREGTPVADMNADDLQYRANRIAYYTRKLKFNEDGKVMLTTNREVSDFLRMLNDEYLVSPLTQSAYEARSKKPLDSEES